MGQVTFSGNVNPALILLVARSGFFGLQLGRFALHVWFHRSAVLSRSVRDHLPIGPHRPL